MRMLPIVFALSALSIPCQASAVSDGVAAGKAAVPAISYRNLPVVMAGVVRPFHLKPAGGIVHHVNQCTTDCDIVYRHCKAIGNSGCADDYNVCMNSCD